MGVYSTKSKWQQALRPFVAFCGRNQVHPDVFTYGAVVLSFVGAFAFLRAGAHRAWLWLVPPCVLVRLLLNLMDGLVAREMGLASAWGEVKNEFGDRVADTAIFLGLGFGEASISIKFQIHLVGKITEMNLQKMGKIFVVFDDQNFS